MATVPTLGDGTVAHQADIAFALNKPYAKVWQSGTGQPITSGVTTAVIWTTVDTDGSPDTMYSSSFNTRLTIGTAGKWAFRAGITWPSNATGRRQMLLRKNGSTGIAWDSRPAVSGDNTMPILVGDDQCVVGDYYEILLDQNSGSTLTPTTGLARIWFVAEWLRA